MKKKKLLTTAFFCIVLMSLILFLVQTDIPEAAADQQSGPQTEITDQQMNGHDKALAYFAAMAAVSFACLASAYALGRIGSAAMGAMSEKPELGGRAIIFLGMAEGIAIYGLIVAIMILNKV